MEPPKKVKPKRPKLTASWSKREKDIIFNYPSRPDGRLLHYVFSRKDSDGKDLFAELEQRGYDLTTFRFSIERITEGKCNGEHIQEFDVKNKRWKPCQWCEPKKERLEGVELDVLNDALAKSGSDYPEFPWMNHAED